ncbi:hypothetical protein AYI68_g193 [Smittium mucronatum]|uniref:Uncharacterized protein n=1 Tax=Smittium mucronatum TaxID=133383 RepID=A0A1R0H929_9FUNG|nr:hypothetical protein AYI68_g193 [Smittium mucronatum]
MTSYASTAPKTKESLSIDFEIIEMTVIPNKTAIQNLLFWKNQMKSCNGLSFLPESPSEISEIPGIMDKIGGDDAHQPQGTSQSSIRTQNLELCGEIGVSILRQHN